MARRYHETYRYLWERARRWELAKADEAVDVTSDLELARRSKK